MTELTTNSPETMALAGWLVGPFSHGEQVRPGELAEWQVPFYELAMSGLRRAMGLQEGQDFSPDLQPDPQKGAELYRELAYDRKVHGMISSLHAYIDDYRTGALTTRLRDHQQDIMDAIARDVAIIGTDRQIDIKSPTGTGKTAILTTLIEALKYREQPSDRVRALVLLPTKDILGQTVNAFRKFTGIEAEVYFGESKGIGDVTAMTYQSFRRALERGDIDKNSFDVVIRDESDTFSRGKTGELIDEYCFDPKTGRNKLVVGLTATPHEAQQLSYERTVLESIHDRLLAPLCTYQRRTGAVVREDKDRDWREDFKDSEVGHLMNNEARNKIIIDEVLSGLASGRRVLVRCIPGQDLRHPKLLQEMLLGKGRVNIKHPFAGDVVLRRIRPVVIPGTMSMRRRELLTGVFNNHLDDSIDALLFVGTLVRGFDSPVAKKVINGVPTRSPSLVEQLLGRVERWFEALSGNVIVAQAVDILDDTESGQVLFEDIINRDAPDGMRYKRGAIIGPGLADLTDVNSASHSAFEPIPADELAAAARVMHRNGLFQLDGVSLLTARPETLHGRAATQAIGAAALLRTAKVISPRQASAGNRVPLARAAHLCETTPADLMLTAHRMRVGLEVACNPDTGTAMHFFSGNAFARLRTRYENSSMR